jgi:hypothetical protein
MPMPALQVRSQMQGRTWIKETSPACDLDPEYLAQGTAAVTLLPLDSAPEHTGISPRPEALQ